jgi:tetratricopeptide (TPR) repeat protein
MAAPTLQQTLEHAVKLHQAGNLGEAEAIYCQVLSREANHPQALHMLGLIAHQAGRHQVALELISRAIAARPQIADMYSNRGLVLMRIGRLQEAIADLQQALALNPNYPEALNNLGNALFQMARYPEAVQYCQRAVTLRPDYAEAHNNLGNSLLNCGRIDDAIASYQRVIALQPDHHEAYNNLGAAYINKNRLDDAIEVMTKALQLNPNDSDVLNNLGNAYKQKGQFEKALGLFRRAVAINPKHPAVQQNMGNTLMQHGDVDGAIAAYRQAISMRGDFAEAHQSLGNALYQKGRLDEATAAFNRAVQIRPDYYEAYSNLGNTLYYQGDLPAAETACRRALALKPGFPAAHWNLGLNLLLQGRLQEGWKEYNWRWQVRELDAPKRDYPMPIWDGGELGGRRILLHAEQGFGDTIQFMRYVPMVAGRGGRIIVGCQQELVPLFKDQMPVERWIVDKETLPDFSVHAALLNLPMILGTTLETIPAPVPYVRANPDAAGRWNVRIKNSDPSNREESNAGRSKAGGLKVGLAWAGRAAHANDRNRSMSLSLFAPLSQIPGLRFFSLQRDKPAQLSQGWPDATPLTDWADELHDFADTAALIENMDVIITVDTALAHLAGAMGKRVWTMLPFMPDWRWMQHREDSPWYPTMRLFRQPATGEWQTPLKKLAEALSELAQSHGGA